MQTMILAEVTRSDLVESVHRGVIAVVDEKGKLIARAGDPGVLTYMRSAAKPVQAIPVVESGAARRYAFSAREIAMIVSSHGGEEDHVAAVRDILAKIGLPEKYLQCGVQMPLHGASAKKLLTQNIAPTALHCTCSGKHAGMLTLARFYDCRLEDYYELTHPVQQMMLQTMAEMAGLPNEDIPTGVDGCGVPVFALTAERMALAYARLVKPEMFSVSRQQACAEITAAMAGNPDLIAGKGRLASDLVRETNGKLIAKDGTEGVFCVGLPDRGWGVAIKIEDGSMRALGPVVISVLKQLDILDAGDLEKLRKHEKTIISNFCGEIVGEIRPTFTF